MDKNPEEEDAAPKCKERGYEVIELGTQMELPLNSMARFGDNHTMKVKGAIGYIGVVILIDSGATHNFITKDLLIG